MKNRLKHALSPRFSSTFLPLLAGLWMLPVSASDLGAHEHGVANLALVQEGNEISVSFTAAADSVIGYEHAPGNEQERKALHHADEVLHHPEQWLSLPVSCELEERRVSLPFLSSEAHKERHHGDEHKEEGPAKAEHENAEYEKDDHGHDEHQHDTHKHETDKHDGGHADVEAHYVFHCDSDQASPLELKLFSQLPYLELLRIEAVSERTVVVSEREGDGRFEW